MSSCIFELCYFVWRAVGVVSPRARLQGCVEYNAPVRNPMLLYNMQFGATLGFIIFNLALVGRYTVSWYLLQLYVDAVYHFDYVIKWFSVSIIALPTCVRGNMWIQIPSPSEGTKTVCPMYSRYVQGCHYLKNAFKSILRLKCLKNACKRVSGSEKRFYFLGQTQFQFSGSWYIKKAPNNFFLQ